MAWLALNCETHVSGQPTWSLIFAPTPSMVSRTWIFLFMEEKMEFFGFAIFGGLSGGGLLAVAAVIFIVGLVLTI